MPHPTDLDTRPGLPEDQRFLLEVHPRETWAGHDNLGGLMRFWLSRHDGFREMGAGLDSLISDFGEGNVAAPDLAPLLVPRLQVFLGELHHHHLIEDHHYFPVFVAAENRMARGFELLENDHEVIHARIEAVAESANALLRDLQAADPDRIRRAADAYAGESGRLISGLMRHLGDEEDLIVPLVLERGEDDLGVA
uniref:hemerythrin domain-containing protein n=1 Tax=Stappia sp. TaxID=1870903 RepID=UPI003BACABAF